MARPQQHKSQFSYSHVNSMLLSVLAEAIPESFSEDGGAQMLTQLAKRSQQSWIVLTEFGKAHVSEKSTGNCCDAFLNSAKRNEV